MIGAVTSVPYPPTFVIVNVPPVEVVRDQRTRTRSGTALVDLTGERPEAHAVGIPDHGHDERLEVDVDGDAEVHPRVHDQRVVADARVHVRELGERVD